jgi:hypothetical protein
VKAQAFLLAANLNASAEFAGLGMKEGSFDTASITLANWLVGLVLEGCCLAEV